MPALPSGATLTDLTNHVAGNDSTWLIPDIDAFNRVLNIYSDSGILAVSDQVAGVLGNKRSVKERDQGVVLQGDFSTQLGTCCRRVGLGHRDVSATCSAMIPQMVRRGFDRGFAVNMTMTAAMVALLVLQLRGGCRRC